MIARTWSDWSKTCRKFSSVSTSASWTPSPHCSTNARSVMPESGTTIVNISHSATMPSATHFQPPSGSNFCRVALPLTDTYLPAVFSSQRCSSTSGNVIATMHTATAAIR